MGTITFLFLLVVVVSCSEEQNKEVIVSREVEIKLSSPQRVKLADNFDDLSNMIYESSDFEIGDSIMFNEIEIYGTRVFKFYFRKF